MTKDTTRTSQKGHSSQYTSAEEEAINLEKTSVEEEAINQST